MISIHPSISPPHYCSGTLLPVPPLSARVWGRSHLTFTPDTIVESGLRILGDWIRNHGRRLLRAWVGLGGRMPACHAPRTYGLSRESTSVSGRRLTLRSTYTHHTSSKQGVDRPLTGTLQWASPGNPNVVFHRPVKVPATWKMCR